MERLSTAEKGWIWMARLLGGSAFTYAALALQFQIPNAAYILIGGLLGGEFVYKASRKVEE